MSIHVSAIIVAAGSGSRMGSELPKQFMLLQGREILSYSVNTFLGHPRIDEVIIVTSRGYLSRVRQSYPDCKLVEGGVRRQDSVARGLSRCDENSRLVLVHDAARPLLPARLIDESLDQLEHFDGVAPAFMPADSMVELEQGGFRNLDRSRLRSIQTPQSFRLEILQRALASGLQDTDEIGLVRRALPEANLTFIEGAREALKITTSLDLLLAEHLLGPDLS